MKASVKPFPLPTLSLHGGKSRSVSPSSLTHRNRGLENSAIACWLVLWQEMLKKRECVYVKGSKGWRIIFSVLF